MCTVDPEKEVRSEHFEHTEKEVRPKRRSGTPKVDFFVFQPKIDFLEMAHTNFVSSVRKTAYQPLA